MICTRTPRPWQLKRARPVPVQMFRTLGCFFLLGLSITYSADSKHAGKLSPDLQQIDPNTSVDVIVEYKQRSQKLQNHSREVLKPALIFLPGTPLPCQ